MPSRCLSRSNERSNSANAPVTESMRCAIGEYSPGKRQSLLDEFDANAAACEGRVSCCTERRRSPGLRASRSMCAIMVSPSRTAQKTRVAVRPDQNLIWICLYLHGTQRSCIIEDMHAVEFINHLKILGVSQTDAAVLLRVTPRSIRRWQKGEQSVPGTVGDLLRAWVRLRRDDQQLKAHQEHALSLDAVLCRVKARNGPSAPWRVDLRARSASLRHVTVSFYALANGGFSLANYRRHDTDPDVQRDRQLLEDAVYCIADAVKKFGPKWVEVGG
jgi:hypothetical protein